MPGRVVTVTALGNTKDLEDSFRRAGLVVSDSANTMVDSAKRAGAAAAEQAKQAGASADEQIAAAGRAATAFVAAQDEMTRAQKVASAAAADAAKRMGLSADEQEAAAARAAQAAEVSGSRISKAFDDGTTKAGNALSRLGKMGESWGIPMSGSLSKMGKQFDEAETKSAKLGSALSSMGKLTLGAGIVGFTAAAYEGVKGAAALQKQMEMIHTQAGATQAEVGKMTGAVEGMSASVGTGPQQLAEGLYHVESVGLRGAKAMNVLKIAAEGAKVGNANLVDVTNALDAAIVSGISGVQNYGQAMGAMNSIVGSGDMKMQDLADAFGTGLLGPMKTYGLSIRDVGAALAVFGDNNIRGQDAATKLTSAIRIMAAPSAAASKALGAVGLSTLQLASDMRSGGIVKALEDLKTHLHDSGATADQQGLIIARAFGGRQSTGVQVLLHQVSRLQEKYADIGKGSHSFGSDWLTKEHELSFETEQLHAAVTVLDDKLGAFLIPKIQELGHDTGQAIGWMERHKAIAEALGLTIGGVLSVAVAVYAEQKLVKFGRATATAVGDLAKFAGAVESAAARVIARFTAEDEAATVSSAKIEAASATSSAAVEAEAAKMQMSFEEIDTGFAGTATSAETAASGIEGTMATEAGAVAAADSEIEASNTAAGASFASLAGKIGMIGVAFASAEVGAHAFGAALEGITGEKQAKSLSELIGGETLGEKEVHYAKGPVGSAAGGNVTSFLQKHGLSHPAAEGVMRALYGESGLNPKATGSEGAYGIAQWLGSRLEGLKKYAGGKIGPGNAAGPGDSMQEQLEYLWYELNHGERGTLKGLEGAKSSRQAAELFIRKFERPENSQIPKIMERAFGSSAPKGASHAATSHETHPTESKALKEYLESATGSKKKKRKVEPYVSPFLDPAGLHRGREDEGIDFSGLHPGARIGAIGSGVIDKIIQDWYKGEPLIEEELTSGTHKGQHVYYAEQIASMVREGQRVKAGQTIGTYAKTGTGLEFGFGAGGGRTLAQATTGYKEGQVTPAAVEYSKFLATLGKPGSALGVANLVAATEEKEAKKHAAAMKRLEGSGTGKLKTYEADIQTGNIKILEKLLGAHTVVENAHGSGIAQPTLTTAKSEAEKAFDKLVKELRATHEKGLVQLASQLTVAHKQALSTLDAELLASQEKADVRKMNLEVVEMKDQTKIAEDMAMKVIEGWKDAENLMVTGINNATTALKDAGQSISDAMSAEATAIRDNTQEMADANAAAVQQIQDRSQTEVDKLGERGLYGLNLVAQQQQVSLDQMKTGYDAQNAFAQQAIDKAQTETDSATAATQAMIDAVTAQQDVLVGQAKTSVATTEQNENAAIQGAQQNLDNVTRTTNQAVQEAENAAQKVATGTQAQQQIAEAAVEHAKAEQSKQVAQAEASLAAAKNASSAALQQAQNALSTAEANAAKAEQEASNAVANAKGHAEIVLAEANKILVEAQDKANIAEAEQQALIEKTKAEANTQYAGSGLTVNIEGVNPTDAAAIASEVGWVMRTQIPA